MSWPRPSKSAFACLALFAIVAVLMVSGASNALDIGILRSVDALRTPSRTAAMRFIELLGDGKIEIPAALLVCLLLWIRGRRAASWRYFAFCLSCEAVYVLTKAAFHRPRPTVIPHLGQGGWYSFPSGHAMLGPVIWGAGLALVAQLVAARWCKIALWALAVVICTSISICRIYLGVHYPTDVVAGISLGLFLVLWWWPAVDAASS